MGVSAIGQRKPSIRALRNAAAILWIAAILAFYLYGPPLVPKFEQAATDECNRYAGSNYRTYRLEWRTLWYGEMEWPHWSCWDAREPDESAKNLGWWVPLS